MPGGKRKECGNYLDHDVSEAKAVAEDMLKVCGNYFNFIKYGWGTSILCDDKIVQQKNELYASYDIKSYTGVVPTGYGTYRAKIYNGTRNVPIDATFNNQFSAAVYHDAYCWMYPSNTSNNIPFNIAEFMEAQNNRLGNGGHPYNGYLRMYTLIDNNTHNKIGG